MGRIELRHFNWVGEKLTAIIKISQIQGLGLKAAKQTYEQLDECVQEELFVVEEDASWDRRNFLNFLNELRCRKVLNYNFFDFDAEEEKECYRLERERLIKAQEWFKEQSPEHQKMIQLLMDSVSTIIC